MEKVRDEGVYLLENGIHVLLFVGLAVDPQWIQVPSRFCLTPIYDLQMFILIGQVETLLYLSKSQWNLKWEIPGCLWSGYCRADRHRQNEIGWAGQSTVQKGESVDLLCQHDFLMSIILKSVSGVWHLHSSDCEQAADNEADDREAERQAWDCLQGGLWVKMLYTRFSSIS